MKYTALLFLLVCPAFAGEYAVLQNGFRIHADRHEVTGATTRLYTDAGTMEVPSTNIASYEKEDYVAPPPPKPAEPVAVAPVVAAAPITDPKELLNKAATANGLRPEFVQSVAAVESAFNPNAVSPKGALGLMQLMPGTAAQLGANPKDPSQNAEAGARYLKQLLLKYKNRPDGVRLAIAAYNAGPAAVDKYNNIPPYRETIAYVEKVVRKYLDQLNKTK